MGEMWHADAEWYDNYGDKVKIETEKYDGLETKNCSLVVLACIGPGFYFYVRACVLAEVEQQCGTGALRTASRTNLQPCDRNGGQHLPKTAMKI